MNNRISLEGLLYETVIFDYINWKGKASTRTVRVRSFYYGTSEYHSGPQFFLRGEDLDKQEIRDFATKDITNLRVREGWMT